MSISSRSQLDELSIDSATNKKVPVIATMTGPNVGAASKNSNALQCDTQRRPHFRIDWRQLTYYHNEGRSFINELFKRSNRQARRHDQNHDIKTDGQLAPIADGCWNRHETNANCLSPWLMMKSKARGGQATELEVHQSLDGRKRILNSLDGCFKSGELNAILGPSGAGKSTFLSALFGNKQESSYGQTRVTWLRPNGQQMAPTEVDRQRSISIAFLPQHDHLLNHLTVYETLMFASKIKNPKRSNDKSFHRVNVKRVAKMLKLTDCFNTRCCRLSGGQCKRVSIGQELLSQPDVIILDEPTSGLDAMTCLTTIRTLKSIVMKQPICIILTIHQPDMDVFNLFDQVYVIAQGGMAIYEGPPADVVPTLAQVNLFMPTDNYNPARFIVENAFVADLEAAGISNIPLGTSSVLPSASPGTSSTLSDICTESHQSSDEDEEDDHNDNNKENYQNHLLNSRNLSSSQINDCNGNTDNRKSFLSRSISSLTDVAKSISLAPPVGCANKLRDSGRRPLLNIGIRTAEGKLITSEVLAMRQQNAINKAQMERLSLLRRLNELQKEKYYGSRGTGSSDLSSDYLSSEIASGSAGGGGVERLSSPMNTLRRSANVSLASSSSLSSYSEARSTIEACDGNDDDNDNHDHDNEHEHEHVNNELDDSVRIDCMPAAASTDLQRSATPMTMNTSTTATSVTATKLRRKFDKRLSAKHIQSRQRDYPIWYHTFLLTHRTWLSIVRDPIFFGIQFTMHTTIPILLALIFGSQQEEACPEMGNFDLVEFAYQPSQTDVIQSTMRSIRQSIGNIGIVFFEMFVLSFAINCITALVFPLDMYVLLKEYRNGWYSLLSYFMGRTLADLPVPIVLHSIAMTILYYLTGQPLILWRFAAIIGIVILASLVAQSVGLTIGALLMRSSQSAVLAAAGIVAPFFALSGFIVRIHTLPWVAQLAARGSYLYHLLNGFIIMRYGFDRCQCQDEDFDVRTEAHPIPANLKTMASMWIGTYSNEYEHEARQLSGGHQLNKTNIDPNIDIIDKLMVAFKMANSFGHKVESCSDVVPYAMLDFNIKDSDIWGCCLSLVLMLIVSRFITFSAIYYKVRSFS